MQSNGVKKRQRAYLGSMRLSCSGLSGVDIRQVFVLLNRGPGQSGRHLGLCGFLSLPQDIFNIFTLGMDAVVEL